MGLPQFRGHGCPVIEVGKADIRIGGTSVKNGLGDLLDFGLLCVRGGGPEEAVVDNILGIAIIAFLPSADSTHPGHVYVRDQHTKIHSIGKDFYKVTAKNIRGS